MCADCGVPFELSARNTRIHRNRRTSPKCDPCRDGARPPRIMQAMRDYWLDRFTVEEIREMAAANWG